MRSYPVLAQKGVGSRRVLVIGNAEAAHMYGKAQLETPETAPG
jgi:hypothetical protein